MPSGHESQGGREHSRHALTSAPFEALLHGAPCPLALLDANYRFVRVNPAFARFFHAGPDAFPGKSMEEALGPAWAGIPAGTPSAEGVVVHVAEERDGRQRHLEALIYAINDGEAFGLAVQESGAGPNGSEPSIAQLVENEAGRRARVRTEAMPAIVAEATPRGDALYFNQRWYDYTGLTPEESFFGRWRNAVHPEDLARVQRAHEAGELTGDVEFEFRLRRADGEYRWHLGRRFGDRDENGKLRSWIVTAIDIDDRKQAVEALARSEERHRRLANAMAALVMETTADGAALWCNKAFLTYSGLSEQEFSGHGWMQIVHPDDVETFPASLEDIESPWTAEVRLRNAAGEYRWHLGRAVGGYHRGDTKTWVCTAIDIHDRKVAEDARERASTLVRQLADALPVLVAVSDSNQEIVYLSPRWSEYTGVPLDQISAPEDALSLFHPDDQPAMRRMAEAQRRHEPDEAEVRIRRRDGTYRWHWIRSQPVRVPQDELTYWTALAIDIHDRKIAEDTVRRHAGQLRAMAEAATEINSRADIRHILSGLTKRARRVIGAHAAITTLAVGGNWSNPITAVSTSPEAEGQNWEELGSRPAVCDLILEGHPIRLTRAEAATHPAFANNGNPEAATADGVLAVPLKSETGQVLGFMLLTNRFEGEFDETDQAVVEQLARFAATTIEKSQLLSELEGERLRLAAVFDQMHAGVIIVSAAGDMLLSNARASQILGRELDPGHYAKLVEGLAVADAEGTPHPFEQLPLTRALNGISVRNEVQRIRRDDGVEVLLSVNASPIRDSSGAVTAAIVTFVDVTQQEAAREALRLSEERYRTLTESMPVAIYSADPNGHCDFVSEHWLRYTGLKYEDSLSDEWKNAIHPDDREQLHRAWRDAIETGTPFEQEYRVRRADGAYRWHLDRARPLRDASGTIRAWVGHAVDIHDRRLIAEREQLLADVGRELALSLDLRETLEHVAVCAVPNLGDFCIVDIVSEDGSIQRVAAAHADPSKAEVLSAIMRLGPRRESDNPIARVLRTGQPEFAYSTAGDDAGVLGDEALQQQLGDTRGPSSYMVVPLRAHGEVLGTLTFVNTDTGRKLGADQLTLAEEIADRAGLAMANARLFAKTEQTAAKLAASEERYRMLVEAIPAHVSVIDRDGRTIFRNSALKTYTGADDTDAEPNQWLESVHPADRDTLLAAVPGGEPIDLEYRLRRHDDVYRWHLMQAVPIRDSEGNIGQWLTVSVDIDPVKQAQEALQRANALKDEFLGLVSHELRTPLTGILGNAQVLLRHWERMDIETRLAALEDIRSEAQRLQRLVENMLVLAGVEGRGEIETEPLLVQRVVPRIVASHQARHPDREITTDFEPGLEPIEASPTYFDQVLGNLLSNAEKYSPPGAPIEVTARAGEGEVQVRVLDRGAGISDEEIENIFRPFYRSARTAASAQGAGLGLAVCKRLIEAQGGRIWARRREGGGTEFGFALPTGVEPYRH